MANIDSRTPRPSTFRPPRVYVPVEKVKRATAEVCVSGTPDHSRRSQCDPGSGQKISLLSKNQQILETKLDNIPKSLAAVDKNVISGARYSVKISD